MDAAKMSKSVRQITVLRKDASGNTTPVAIFKRKASKKKGTRVLGPVERATRQWADAQSRAAASYLTRHNESNGKRKDGWLRDFAINAAKASRKGSKAVKFNRLFSY